MSASRELGLKASALFIVDAKFANDTLSRAPAGSRAAREITPSNSPSPVALRVAQALRSGGCPTVANPRTL
eukprot:9473428-Pyramimonas_sp.AAC.1